MKNKYDINVIPGSDNLNEILIKVLKKELNDYLKTLISKVSGEDLNA